MSLSSASLGYVSLSICRGNEVTRMQVNINRLLSKILKKGIVIKVFFTDNILFFNNFGSFTVIIMVYAFFVKLPA